MKFLKVLSTSAIAAAILASMSATAFAASETDDDFEDAGFSFDFEDDGEDFDTFEEEDLAFGDDDDADFGDEITFEDIDTNKVNDAQDAGAAFAVDTEDDDTDTFAEAEETEDGSYTTADADHFHGGYAGSNYYYGRTYSWNNWDFSTCYWESTEFAPAAIPANATVFDVVDAAYAAGVNSLNIQSLSNFLILNEENFTSDDYSAFIATLYAIKTEIMDEHAYEIFGCDAGSLSKEEDRLTLYRALNRDEKDAISAALINTANSHRVLVSYDTDDEGYPLIYASMRHRIADTPVSSASNTQGAATTGSPVAATGGELPETGSTGAAAFASIALGLAAIGAVVVARKNRA